PARAPRRPRLTLPGGAGRGTGVVPAATQQTGEGTGTARPGATRSLPDLPSGALALFSATPVGGVRGPSGSPAGADRLQLRGREASVLQELLRPSGIVPIIFGVGEDAPTSSIADPAGVAEVLLRNLEGVRTRAVDYFFTQFWLELSYGCWLGGVSTPSLIPEPSGEDVRLGGEPADGDGPG